MGTSFSSSFLDRDPRFPKIARSEFDLLLADLKNQIEHELADLLDGRIDLDDAVEAIVDEILEEGDEAEAGQRGSAP
jgi:hypothetical protein